MNIRRDIAARFQMRWMFVKSPCPCRKYGQFNSSCICRNYRNRVNRPQWNVQKKNHLYADMSPVDFKSSDAKVMTISW